VGWPRKGATASCVGAKKSKVSTFGVIGDGDCCQDDVDDDDIGVAGGRRIEEDGVDRTRGEGWKWVAGFVLLKA
jgi:hypothetical protein